MKSQSIRILFFLFCLKLSGQIKFEKGYFVDTQNKKIECFIKNKDWISMPNEIEYKLSDSSPINTVLANDLNELKIENTSHYYKKYSVLIDKDSDVNKDNFIEETAFFKVLIEGNVSLFQYCNALIFFYEKEKGILKQLKFKLYVDNDQKIRVDNSFRRELYDNLKCEDISFQRAIKLSYERSHLVKFFETFNKCINSEYLDYTRKETKFKLNLKGLVGVNTNNLNAHEVDFIIGGKGGTENKTLNAIASSKPRISFGFEVEVLLPFNKHKWSIFLAPTYQTYEENTSKIYNDLFDGWYTYDDPNPSGGSFSVHANFDLRLKQEYKYTYIEFPVGIRRYFYLNDMSKFFMDASCGTIKQIGTPVEKSTLEEVYQNQLLVPNIIVNNNMARKSSSTVKFSGGYTYKDLYSIILSYNVNKQLSNSRGNSFSILIGYKFF